MKALTLIKSESYNGIPMNFYRNEKDEIYATREQIGQALGYVSPRIAITKIHNKNKDRLNRFSVVTKLVTTDGKKYDTTVYNEKGVYEICRFSRQPKADAFMDWTWELLSRIRKGELSVIQTARAEFLKLTDAVKMNTKEPQFFHYVLESDLVNRSALGMSAKDYKKLHGVKGNTIRPYLSPEETRLVMEIQRADAYMLACGLDYDTRKDALSKYRNRLAVV